MPDQQVVVAFRTRTPVPDDIRIYVNGEEQPPMVTVLMDDAAVPSRMGYTLRLTEQDARILASKLTVASDALVLLRRGKP